MAEPMETTRHRFGSVLLLGALLLPALGGCDFITGDPTPEEARVVLEGEPGTEVDVLMSKNFITAQREDGELLVEVLASQIETVTLPFTQTFDIEEEQQFLARAMPADSTLPTTVRMQVFVDGDSKFDLSRDVRDEPLQFIFLFNRPILDATVEVL